MADFSCASTKQTSHWPAPMSWKAPVRFHVILAVAAFSLAGCNANQTLNPSSRTAPGVVAGLARLMRENALKARQRRRFKRTTDSLHAFPVAPNLLNQDFNATGPNQKGGADISYVWTREGWLYLAVVIDLFARRVVGWAAGDRLHKELALLPMAGSSRGGPATAVYNRFHRWAMRGWWHSLGPRADPRQEPISSGNSSSNS